MASFGAVSITNFTPSCSSDLDPGGLPDEAIAGEELPEAAATEDEPFEVGGTEEDDFDVVTSTVDTDDEPLDEGGAEDDDFDVVTSTVDSDDEPLDEGGAEDGVCDISIGAALSFARFRRAEKMDLASHLSILGG